MSSLFQDKIHENDHDAYLPYNKLSKKQLFPQSLVEQRSSLCIWDIRYIQNIMIFLCTENIVSGQHGQFIKLRATYTNETSNRESITLCN